jgi:CDP-2,3-bis-(O-geranylgeranyl)-sn-glycerol synthase
MLTIVIQALFFFLPAYAANAAPVLLARYKVLEFLNVPVDFGFKMGGDSLFGKTKTWRGIIGGIVAAIAVVIIQCGIHAALPQREYLFIIPYPLYSILWLGFWMGLGEGLGDLAKSFLKRRMGMKSGQRSFPLDQTSFLGALLLGFLYYMPSAPHIWAIVIISPVIPVIANIIAYKAGWKKVWW